AYSSGDALWRLTAVFCMRYVRGFDDQILEALKAENEEIHYEAVCAAGTWGVDVAWSHIASLAVTDSTDKSLRLAAIEAVASIRPQEAVDILAELTLSDDDDIVETAHEAMAMYDLLPNEDYDDDDGDWDERIK
ncbi:MAG: HEAT repeat domain-containing protein, partial [Deltaproteobacteria bacterium]|nr:HEAT repeat domain-containing protein [Deltaproteobacteria bacterium]